MTCRCATARVAQLLSGLSIALGIIGCNQDAAESPSADGRPDLAVREDRIDSPRRFSSGKLTIWWDRVPESVRKQAPAPSVDSNIRPDDYIGPDACRSCHAEQHKRWSRHPHRWMNALANTQSVRGDFSGAATLLYLGGKATFFQEGDGYRMTLVRGSTKRTYRVNQTIGSRFFQYYVGRQLAGPETGGHKFYRNDHVLPFGYWIDEASWVPVVHIGTEFSDDKRTDPFGRPATKPPFFSQYNLECNYCHTTFPLGDMMIRQPYLIGQHAPFSLNLWTPDYLKSSHQELWNGERDPTMFPDDELTLVSTHMQEFAASDHAVSLGISCEACHLGSRQHAKNPKILPRFFPTAPELFVNGSSSAIDYGRTHTNVNWACGRCHTGERPAYAGGLSTWNSIEYTDARLGGCYSKLRCIDCHDPHTGTAPGGWTRPPAETDRICLKCHTKFEPPESRTAHTHHPIGSSGNGCMSCHMPRINEGLQDVVRTHTIHSPTATEPIEANHLNACNLCHTDRPIAWTLEHLQTWYGQTYSSTEVRRNYPGREHPVGTGWLKSDHKSVRLVGLDALARTRSGWALSRMLEALDDPFLINRQFAARSIEAWLGLSLADVGYRFYMSSEERRPGIRRLRRLLVPEP